MATAAPATDTVIKDNIIRIGDHISLKFPKLGSYLSAEGILCEDVYVSPTLAQFEEHLFQIYVQRQYSATNELEEFLESNGLQDTNVTLNDPSLSSHLDALVRGKENESILNRSVMKSKVGNVVLFGDTIQLLHVKSNKFVTIKPADLARDERENMKVMLSYDGSVMSWLKIAPRFKIDREGEPITNGTEILLKVAERSTEFLHCADRAPPKGKFREVNSSMEVPTGWKISLFHKAADLKTVSNLLTGQLICIRDPELQCMVAPLAKGISLDFSRPNSKNKYIADNGKDEESHMEENSLCSMDEFIRENGVVTLRPVFEDTIDSDSIWVMESKSISKAGPMKHLVDRVHLRHFNTGKYLSVQQLQDEETFCLDLEDVPDETKTLFKITELHSTNEFLRNGKAVQIMHAHHEAFLQRGKYHDDQRVYSCCMTRSKSKAVSVIITRYEQKESSHVAKSLLLKDETLDIYFGRAVMYHLDKFVKGISHLVMRHDSTTIFPKIDVADRFMFSFVMARATLFVRGFPIQIKLGSDEFSLGKGGGKVVVLRRQNMFREQGLLQALMKMIKHLQLISDIINSDSGGNRASKSPFVENGKEVLSECLNLLYDLVQQNPANQLYISDHLLIIFAHVSTDKMAAKIAQELLSSNRELQETKVGLNEITIFTEKMREVRMNSMYLHLLRTCCSCQGEALPKNQEIVNQVLYHKFRDVLITTNVDYAVCYPVDWGKETRAYELFIGGKLSSKHIKGVNLCIQGMPSVSLQWDVQSTRFSAVQLYKKPIVPLSEVMLVSRLGGKNFRTTTSTVEEIKRAISDFYVAQLHLAGEMCLGRNYPVIVEMEKLYSYDLLITILRSGNNESLQSSAAYLMLQLYVDRDPQSVVHLPRLTRILADVSSSNFSELVNISGSDGDQFALLQVIIASHLDSVKGKAFPLNSFDMLGLLSSLVKFNFYGTVDALKETIESLHGCLLRGDFDMRSESDGGGLSSSMLKLSASGSTKSMSKRAKNTSKSASSMSVSSSGLENEGDKDDSKMDSKSEIDTKSIAAPRYTFYDISVAVLNGLESVTYNFVLVLLAFAGAGASIYIRQTKTDNYIFPLIQNVVLIIFAVDLLVHYVVHTVVHRSFFSFFFRWENWVSFISCFLYASPFLRSKSISYGLVRTSRLAMVFVLFRSIYTFLVKRRGLGSISNDSGNSWSLSARHQKTDDYTLKTLVRIVDILNNIQQNIDDRMLSLFLKRFYQWSKENRPSMSQVKSIFQGVIDDSADLLVSSEAKDETLIDLLMYPLPELVQTTLDLLMKYHSSRKIFLENVNKLQLITTEEGQEKYFRLEQIISVLKRDVDTHEIWGKLNTSEFLSINKTMFDHLAELTTECKQLRQTLKFDESHEPVKYIQNILRNLGCFEVCMKVAQLVLHVDKDDYHSEFAVNTRNLALAGNQLMIWLILDNPANQALAYGELKFFIKTIDSKIDSHRVISSIFRDNIELMELVPKKYIAEFVDNICNVGKFPQYLSLMGSIINVGEKNVIGNQYEVIKLMASPENQKKIIHFFVGQNHPDYAKKIRLMSSYMNTKDVVVSELPSELAYHLELMKLLSSCTIGTSGMTTIEAKVQSMFPFVDVVESMLDPNCLLLGKIRLGQYLYNAVMDVETPVPAVKDAACIWKILVAAQDVFTFAKDELRQIEKNGWDAPSSNRQKIEYMIVNAMLVESYFSAYFDRTVFKPEIGQTAPGVERVNIKENQGNEIIKSLFVKIMAIYEMLSPLLQPDHHEILYKTLVILNDAAKEKIVNVVENIHESFLKSAQEYDVEGGDKLGKAFEDFVNELNGSEDIKAIVDDQIQHFIEKIEHIPWKAQAVGAAVAFEPLVDKLVHHVRGCVKMIIHGEDSMKYMDVGPTKTSIWILKMFRTMIENRWGMTIYERDDDGGEEQDEAVIDLMKVYNESGVTEMCLDLIAKGIDISLQAEALKLLVGMLFKEGGALDIQKSIHSHLSQPGSDMFFRTVRHILHNLISWHKWNGVIVLEDEAEPELPDEIIIVRCLQLMCEGHYGPNQDIMREQPNNNVSINLLDDFVLYLQCLDPIKCRTSTTAELAVAATVLEVIQGPCEGNQDYFALNTELIETLNRKLRQHPVHDCDEDQELELKKSCIDIFQALLEGQGQKTAVYERLLSVIHIDVIIVLCKGGEDHDDENGKDGEIEGKEESEESATLRTESLVLLQMLTDFRPTLKDEIGLGEDFNSLGGDSVACIELVWHGVLQRRFFSIPDICRALAKSTKDAFILNVKRASPEDKLYGLLMASKEMYREVMHQQMLSDYKLDVLFSKTNIDRTVWGNFYIVLAINILFMTFYTSRDVPCESEAEKDYHDAFIEYHVRYYDPYSDESTITDVFCSETYISSDKVSFVIFILNLVLICGAAFTLLSTIVVRGPVNFQAYREAGMGFIKSIIYTGSDFFTVYCMSYLGVAVVGLFYHPALSMLLLDFITLSPTSQAVLRAVYNPRKQIFMTLILTFIIMYIFAIFQFFFINGPDDFTVPPTYVTLGNFYKFVLRWGLPYNSPQNQMVLTIYSFRVISDLAFFMACLILLNILKGITIDTFVELRKALEARTADTTEKCFICGIEKNTFNRTLDRTAFRTHITHDQNLWNYLYFIMYIWQQDKDDDDGLESYVRKCIDAKDLIWFPMNKAIRLAEHQKKGDVHSLKYRFRKDMEKNEGLVADKMVEFKDQVSRTMTRVEKALEYEHDEVGGGTSARKTRNVSRQFSAGNSLVSVSRGGSIGSNPSTPQLNSGRAGPRSLLNALGDDGSVEAGSAAMVDSARSAFSKESSLGSVQKSVNFNLPGVIGHATALDADNAGQMHMRVVFISGMILNPSYLRFVSVKVITEFQTTTVFPLTEIQVVNSLSNEAIAQKVAEMSDTGKGSTNYTNRSVEKVTSTLKNTRSSFSLSPQAFAQTRQLLANNGFSGKHQRPSERFDHTLSQVQMRFDTIDTVQTLAHQGPLPKYDLSKIMVKVQVLYSVNNGRTATTSRSGLVKSNNVEENDGQQIYLGGAKVPLIQLIAKAHDGTLLEIPFKQVETEIPIPSTLKDLESLNKAMNSSDSTGDFPHEVNFRNITLPANENCVLALSPVASHKLLQDFAFLRS